MIGPSTEAVVSNEAANAVDYVVILGLRAPDGSLLRALGVRQDCVVDEFSEADLAKVDRDRLVEIAVTGDRALSVGTLLSQGGVRILRGAPLLREHARLLRQAAAAAPD